MVLTRDDSLQQLVQHGKVPGSPVLSIYLCVDQSDSRNLKRGFGVALKNLLRSVEQTLVSRKEKDHFAADAATATGFVASYSPKGKSLALFCDASEDFLWHRSLRVPVAEAARWCPCPYLRPLVEAQDTLERYGVVVTDRAQARLFTVFMGEIEENVEALAQADVKRFAGPARDQERKQDILQRKADEHARQHLRNVADMMTRLADARQCDRLILAGPPEAVAELQKILPERLRERIVATTSLPITATEQDIIRETARTVEESERSIERTLIERLLTASAKGRQAVVGLPATAEAAAQGKILSLVYANGYSERGSECDECGVVFAQPLSACPYCRSNVKTVNDLVEWLVESTARSGEAIKQVRGDAAQRLISAAGNIGAFLRF